MPDWLNTVAIIALVIAIICTAIIAADILAGHRQHMAVMNFVWPITALYAGPLALWAYFMIGRLSTEQRMRQAQERGEQPPSKRKPFWQSVGLAATHCGSGCTLGDLVAEWLMVLLPFTLFGRTLFAAWALDFVLAFIFGIVFQYFTIAPMRHLSFKDGLIAALKADSLSLTSWQIGMYGWMAIVVFLLVGHELPKTSPVFWFMMQIAMLAGFLTSYPVNWWLVKQGLKENM